MERYRQSLEEMVKERTEEIAAGKERLSVTLRSIGDGVITTDIEGKVLLINKVAEKLCGFSQEEAFGRPLTEVFCIINEKTRKPCEDPVQKVLKTGKIVGLANDTVLVAKDGTERIIADSGSPIRDRQSKIIGVVLVFRDVTEKEKVQQELQKIERLESIGLLAGGIAHDFNNILSVVFSIIKKHNGHICLESELGVGTTFYIYLPACEKKMPLEKKEAEEIIKGEGRILLMNDEKVILESAGEVLRELGYEVEVAKDGDEAISLYQTKKTFDLVIMDLTIPGGMGGKEAIKKLKRINPVVKAIVSSGYSNDLVIADFARYGFCGVVTKPYKIKELSQVIHKVLMSS